MWFGVGGHDLEQPMRARPADYQWAPKLAVTSSVPSLVRSAERVSSQPQRNQSRHRPAGGVRHVGPAHLHLQKRGRSQSATCSVPINSSRLQYALCCLSVVIKPRLLRLHGNGVLRVRVQLQEPGAVGVCLLQLVPSDSLLVEEDQLVEEGGQTDGLLSGLLLLPRLNGAPHRDLGLETSTQPKGRRGRRAPSGGGLVWVFDLIWREVWSNRDHRGRRSWDLLLEGRLDQLQPTVEVWGCKW